MKKKTALVWILAVAIALFSISYAKALLSG